jgi:hypothetical protein
LDAADVLIKLAAHNVSLRSNLVACLRSAAASNNIQTCLDICAGIWWNGTGQNSVLLAEAEAALSRLLSSAEVSVRRQTAKWLIRGRGAAWEIGSELTRALTNAISDPDRIVALHAVNAADYLFYPKESWAQWLPRAFETYNRCLQDPSPTVRRTALEGVRYSSWWSITTTKETRQYKRTPTETESWAYLRSTADPRIIENLTNALHDPDPEMCLTAAQAIWLRQDLRQGLGQRLAQIMQTALTSSQPEVQVATLWVLRNDGATSGEKADPTVNSGSWP